MSDAWTLQVAASVATWAATYLLHSTVLLAAAALMVRLPGLPPSLQDVVWKTALIAGVVTATAAVGPEVVRSMDRHVAVEAHLAEGVGSAGEARGAAGVAGSPDGLLVGREGAGPGIRSTQIRATVLVEQRGLIGWPLLGLLAVWLGVATVGVVRHVRLCRDVRRLRDHFVEPSERTRRLFREMVRGVEGVDLVRCDAVGSPCVLPRRTIALPGRCETEMTDAELKAVLGHEVGHAARDDVRWSALLRLMSAVLWIQPLNAYGIARLREVAEVICDDWALSRTDDAYGLAASIAKVAGWAAGEPAYGVSMIGGTQRLSDRVERILRGDRGGAVPGWGPIAIGALLLLPSLWLPVVRTSVLEREVQVEERTVEVGAFDDVERRSMRGERYLVIAHGRRN